MAQDQHNINRKRNGKMSQENMTVTEKISEKYFSLSAELAAKERTLQELREMVEDAKETLRIRQLFLRENPAVLCAEIATLIRREEGNSDPEKDNGRRADELYEEEHKTGHWYQNQWGEAFAKNLVAVKTEIRDKNYDSPIRSAYSVSLSCPTTACVAGWTGTLTGYRMLFPVTSPELMDPFESFTADYFLTPDGERRPISEVAKEILGLDRERADWLFNGYRTREGVLWALDQMAMGDFQWEVPEDDEYLTPEGQDLHC